MNIIITQLDRNQDIVYVLFECAHGQGKGVWRGEEAEIGMRSYVELDIEELQSAARVSTGEKSYAMEFVDGATSITGNIVTVQDDVALFRFAETIIQIDYCFKTIDIGEWATISVAAHNLLLYPVNL